MNKVIYVVSCIFHMDYLELFRTVKLVHEASGKNRMSILFDIVYCGFRYGAGFNDYLLCEFYNLNREQRATYVTRSVNNTLVSLLNDRAYYHTFDNKNEFYSMFSDCMGRGWMDFASATLEQFQDFMAGREEIMVKPDAESGGKGVEKVSKNEYPSLEALYEKLKSDDIGVIEDVVVQHEKMASLNPSCLNTLRVVTILNDKGPHIIYAYIRVGNSDRPVDNLHSGGMCAPIDLETGKIQYPGYDKNRVTYLVHPKTGVKIQGFELPYWMETVSMCLKAAIRVPQMRYIGWDVGITENGPVFVEGNNLPGYDFLQMPPHVPDKVGMLPRFKEFVDGI